MIEVVHLSKKFSGQTAVDDVSFQVEKGEVVGFLGPNGAGKTTTMRMITGYLPPTAGSVQVAGYDMMRESLKARRHLGYLPEHCPLYLDMRVDEYLRFRARLKGLTGRERRQAVREAKALCNLEDVGRRIIGQLSKGFRQRVGLADALVHKPDLLILDEPTLGLDPNQIRYARELIQRLAEQHTILISSHILSEIEHTCDRVLILNQGRVIASDSPAALRGRMRDGGTLVAEIQAGPAALEACLVQLDGVEEITMKALDDGWFGVRMICEQGSDLRADLYQLVAREGWVLRELRNEERSLEDAFVELTRAREGQF